MPDNKDEKPVAVKHPVLSYSEDAGWREPFKSMADAREHMADPEKFKPEDFVDLASGNYGHGNEFQEGRANEHRQLIEHLADHPHAHDPKVRDQIFNNLTDKYKKASEEELTRKPDEDDDDFKSRNADRGNNEASTISSLIRHFGGDKEHLQKYLDMVQNDKVDSGTAFSSIRDSKRIEPDALAAIMANDKYKDYHGAALLNENVPEAAARAHINKNIDEVPASSAVSLAAHKHATPAHQQKALEKIHGSQYAGKEVVDLLKSLPEDQRKEHTDRLLGIHGGKKDDEDGEEYNNWKFGDDYNEDAADHLSQSDALSDEQVNHLMKHGTDDQKLNLFHNPNLKPEHYQEMYQKYEDDDDEHGYGIDKLKEKIKEEHEDHVYDNYGDAALEEAESNYPFNDFLRDIDDREVAKIGEKHRGTPTDDIMSGLVDEKMKDWEGDHDWEGDNPDYDEEKGESEDNPKKIDFSKHKEHSITDHPDYEDRENDARDNAWNDVDSSDYADAIRKHWRENEYPDELHDSYRESIQEAESDAAHRLFQEDLDNALESKEFMPKHIQEHVPHFKDAAERQRVKEERARMSLTERQDAEAKEFLDPVMPNRENSFEYGQGQHHHEMVKDYADANGGKIDIGAMNKMHPNLKDKWKEVFGDKGKLSSDEIQQKIDAIPKTKYNISYGKWDKHKMQNANGQDEAVIRLDHSDDSMKDIDADPETRRVFDKINEAAQRSGHPTNPKSIAWMRLDPTNKKHWFMDELQSDFESSARDYLEANGHGDLAKHVDKINEHHANWREALMNHVIKTAKKHGVEALSTHSDESKAAHTGADKVHSVYQNSYRKVPRALGFKPADAETLPLSEKGKEIFNKGRDTGDVDERVEAHREAMKHHAAISQIYKNMAKAAPPSTQGNLFPDTPAVNEEEKYNAAAEHHLELSRQHKEKGSQLDPSDAGLRGFRANVHYDETPRPEGGHQAVGYSPYEESIPDLTTESSDPEEVHKTLSQSALHSDPSMPSGYVHPHDKLLTQANPKPAKAMQGHTLQLTAPVLKKAIEFAESLIKMEALMFNLRSRLSVR